MGGGSRGEDASRARGRARGRAPGRVRSRGPLRVTSPRMGWRGENASRRRAGSGPGRVAVARAPRERRVCRGAPRPARGGGRGRRAASPPPRGRRPTPPGRWRPCRSRGGAGVAGRGGGRGASSDASREGARGAGRVRAGNGRGAAERPRAGRPSRHGRRARGLGRGPGVPCRPQASSIPKRQVTCARGGEDRGVGCQKYATVCAAWKRDGARTHDVTVSRKNAAVSVDRARL